MSGDVLNQLKSSLLELDMEGALAAARMVREDRQVAVEEAVAAVSEALKVVGSRFQEGEWFLTELVYAGEIAKEVMGLLSPLMETGAGGLGTVVVGTVAGDLHDLGKNIFINYARSAGFKVIDLGMDVNANSFVNAVKENSPFALGMSCLLTSTDGEIVKVVEDLKKAGLREKVRIIIGGAALTEQFAETAGVDAFAKDAITGIDIIRNWSGG